MMKAELKAIGMLVGIIFGAGAFALPYAFMKAGVFWGTIHFFVALVLMIFLHYWYGEIAYFSEGRRRLTGYAEIFLGKKAKWFSFAITLFTDYGALFAYGLLGGIFLANIFAVSPFLFFAFTLTPASMKNFTISSIEIDTNKRINMKINSIGSDTSFSNKDCSEVPLITFVLKSLNGSSAKF